MKKRYLLLLTAIAVALVLMLPGTALATETTIWDSGYFDLGSGLSVTWAESWDLHYFSSDTPSGPERNFLWNTQFVSLPGADYEGVSLSDTTALTFAPMQGEMAVDTVYVMRTVAGDYFKLKAATEQTSLMTYTFTSDPLVPLPPEAVPPPPPEAIPPPPPEAVPSATPEAMLASLAASIADMAAAGFEADGMDPVIARSLTAKADSSLAALTRGKQNYAKVVTNDLKALMNQVEAQTDKKISPEAAAELIGQANAIIAALGY